MLLSSCRPSAAVQEQLRELGVPDDAYDATVTSGDLTRYELAKHKGARVFHLGLVATNRSSMASMSG